MTGGDDQPSADRAAAAAGISRRGVLGIGVGVGVAGLAMAACSQAPQPDNPTVSGSANPAGGGGSGSGGSGSGGSGKPLAQLSAIPVGGAVSAQAPDGSPLIIARPTSNTVAAFSAICTHQGCTVVPAGKELDCPCHGSVYNATTGAVINGPAPSPLPTVRVTLTGDNVVAG